MDEIKKEGTVNEKKKYTLKSKIRIFFLRILLLVVAICFAAVMGVYLTNYKVVNDTKDDVEVIITGDVSINTANAERMKEFGADCILILGAGIKDENTPSPMLKDRLDAGIEMYKEGVAPKLLLSGDNGQVDYNEIHVMLNYAKKAGVPDQDIFCDHAGFSTYDSMYRAGSIFKAKKVIVVTQKYHLYRALYIGKELGLEVLGVGSDQAKYVGQTYRDVREYLARTKDFFKAAIKSDPTMKGDTIPISGSGIQSHGER